MSTTNPVSDKTPPTFLPPVSDKNEYKATKLALCILGSLTTGITAGLYAGYCLIKYTVIKPNIATALALVTVLAIGVIAFAIFSKHAFKTPPVVSPVSRKNSDALPKALKKKASPVISPTNATGTSSLLNTLVAQASPVISPPSDPEISSNGFTNKIPPVASTTCSSSLSSPNKLQIQIPIVTDNASGNSEKQLTGIEPPIEENATTGKSLGTWSIEDLGTVTKELTQLSPNVKIPVDSPKVLLQFPEVFTVSPSASDADVSSTTASFAPTKESSSGPGTDSSEPSKTKKKRRKKKKKQPTKSPDRIEKTAVGKTSQERPHKIGAASGKKPPTELEKLN